MEVFNINYKNPLILFVLLVFIISIGCVSASDNTNQTTQSSFEINEINTQIDNNCEDILSDANSEIYVNDSVSATGNGSKDSPFKSISEAVTASTDGDTIYIASGSYSGTNNVALTIDKSLSIKAYGNDDVILDGEKSSWLFYVTSSNVLIDGITFINAYAGWGSAIYYESGSTSNIINNSRFINNSASDSAGAVYFDDDENSQILNTIFENNTATYNGGAIFYYRDVENTLFSNVTFKNNTASNNGGAIYYFYGTYNCNFTNVSFANNKVSNWYGGAILFNIASNISIVNSNFTNNVAGSGGGSIIYWSDTDNVTCVNTNFENNDGSSWGGALLYWSSSYNDTFINSTFKNNTANQGSAIYVWNANNLNLTDDSFTYNKAQSSLTQTINRFKDIISVTLEGGNNIINAIYSSNMDNFNFSNVTYGSVNGIANSDEVEPVYSSYEADENITCEIYDSETDELLFNETKVTDENGSVTFNYSNVSKVNSFKYTIYHTGSDYYAFAETSGNFNLNVGDFEELQYLIDEASENDVIELTRNYTYTIGLDSAAVNINKNNLTINGNGFTIDALARSKIFNVQATTFNLDNVTLKNAYSVSNGGAVYFSSTASNCTFSNVDFINNTALYGGAIYAANVFNNNMISNSNFTNNSGNSVYFSKYTNNNSFENSFFINNARAIYFSGPSNNDSFINVTFNNNTVSKKAGAICFYGKVEDGSFVNSTFINNKAGSDGGAIFFEKDVENTVFANSTFENNAAKTGGAISFDEDGIEFNNVSFEDMSFINNSAVKGGAVYFKNSDLLNIKIANSKFINNSAGNGGAVCYVESRLENVDYINVSFINNSHNAGEGSTAGGGAISYYSSTYSENERIINSTFINNSATYCGGAILYYGSNSFSYAVINTTFVNNYATEYGGAIYLSAMENGQMINVTCINNSAGLGGAIYFIRNCSSNEISNSIFVNNTGNAIYYYGNAANGDTIKNSVFMDNTGSNIYSSSSSVAADYNWFGNNATDYNVKPSVSSAISLTNWLFLNASTDNATVYNGEKSNIKFVLELYDSSSQNIIDDDYQDLNQVALNLTSLKMVLLQNKSSISENIEFIANEAGNGSITAKYFAAEDTVEFTILKGNSSVVVDDVSINYGSTIELIANCSNSIGIAPKLFDDEKDVTDDYLSWDGFNITIKDDLPCGSYVLKVTTVVDEENYNSVTNSSNIVINKAPSSIVLEEYITVFYGDIIATDATCVNATGISAKVYDKSGNEVSAGINITGFEISISGIDAGNYTLNVTTVTDSNHASSSNVSNISINKTNSSVYVKEYIHMSEPNSIIIATTVHDNATGINATLYDDAGNEYDDYVVISEFDVFILIEYLSVGHYNLNITTIVNNNHISVTNTSDFEFRTGSGVFVDDVAVTYGESVYLTAVCENATGVNVTVYDENGNEISVNATISDFNITISGLDAGNYTLRTNTLVRDYYDSTSYFSTISVNKADSSVTLDDCETVYGDVINISAIYVNATAITAEIYSYDSLVDANISTDGFNITITGLNAGNYTLIVSTVVEDNYNSASNESYIIVNKADIVLTFNNVRDINPSESEMITIELSATDIDGNLTYTIDEIIYPIVNNTIILNKLAEGNYSVLVELVNDTNYRASNFTTFSVSKVDSNINVTSQDIKVDETEDILIILPGDATGNVTVNINDNSKIILINESTVKGLNGILIMHLAENNLSSDNYTVIVTYNGNDKYNPSNATANFSVTKFDDYVVNVTYEDNEILISLAADATGNITIEIGNRTYSQEISNGYVEIDVSDLDNGNYTAAISYPGNYKYEEFDTGINISVIHREINLVSPSVVKYYRGSERLHVYLLDYKDVGIENENLTIIVNGVSYKKTTDEHGQSSLALNLNSGEYAVTISYGGSDEFDAASINTTVTIKSTVNGTDLVKVFRNETQYYATFIDSEGNYLSGGTVVQFNINGVFYNKTIGENGIAKLNINLSPGEYIITAINSVTGEMGSNNIKVLSSITEYSNLVKYYRNDSQYVVRILGDDGSPVGAGEVVTFNINGVFYNKTTNESGYVQLSINLSPGEYIITADYMGCKVSNNITVKPVLFADDLSMQQGDGSTFDVKLLDGQGNPYANQKIEFNINGVFYYRTTNSSGVASLNINLQSGEYIITSSYGGTNIANSIKIN